jgi:hypothetical protein
MLSLPMPKLKIVILPRPLHWEGEVVAYSWKWCYVQPGGIPLELGRVCDLSTKAAIKAARSIHRLYTLEKLGEILLSRPIR